MTWRPQPWQNDCSPEDRLRALDEVVDGLVDVGAIDKASALECLRLNRGYCHSAHGWDAAYAALMALRGDATIGNLMVTATYDVFTADQLETLGAALRTGARPLELLALGVHGRNAAGEDLPVLPATVLRRRLEAAVELGQDHPSGWLGDYATRLVAEARRRRGDGHSA